MESSAVVYQDGQGAPFLKPGAPSRGAVAWGSFEDGLNISGWGILDVNASGLFSDNEQHRAAGMVEGYLTAEHIHSMYLNMLYFSFKGNVSKPTADFLAAQVAWSRHEAAKNLDDPVWLHAGAVLAQLDGLQLGYAAAAAAGRVPPLEEFAFLAIQAVGDIFQIMPAVDKHRRADVAGMPAAELRRLVLQAGMCSGLIKVTGDLSDLFMAHSAWFSYSNTDRIMKHYSFDYHVQAAGKRVSFSSYPAMLESLDDFYMMDSGLGMVQTSNNILNQSLLDLITPQSLLAWQRVRIANAYARTGPEWHQIFKQHASGTYVNQYMVVNFNLFRPHSALPDELLWIIEEIPGLVQGSDQTAQLRMGYWPSYNVPFFRDVYLLSGYNDTRLGPDGDYQLAKRAQIFRRDQATVTDMASLKRIMRYANYSDVYAIDGGKIDYGAAICMREDLDPESPRAGGCYDSKVTSFNHGFWELSSEIVNGPSSTASDGAKSVLGNAPFEWTGQFANAAHHGLPAKYAFDFILAKPKELPCRACEAQEEESVIVF